MGVQRKYTVVYERDQDGWWATRVSDLPGCRTQGRTIDQARRRIRQAMELFIGDAADDVELIDDVRLPKYVRDAVEGYSESVSELEDVLSRCQKKTQQAAVTLVKRYKLSFADAGELLGISRQRVHQIVKDDAPRAAKKVALKKAGK